MFEGLNKTGIIAHCIAFGMFIFWEIFVFLLKMFAKRVSINLTLYANGFDLNITHLGDKLKNKKIAIVLTVNTFKRRKQNGYKKEG